MSVIRYHSRLHPPPEGEASFDFPEKHKNPDPDHIPCFRVVNAKGELAGAFAFGGADVQAELLREDGVEVVDGKVDLTKYQMADLMEE